MRADELLEVSGLEGFVVWDRVLKAVEDLLDRHPLEQRVAIHQGQISRI